MSREIKFRAWDKQDKKMYSMVNDYFSGRTIWYLNTQECESEFEIMQFTGLFDKNGVEIYEGDVILGDGEDMPNRLITWSDVYLGFFAGEGKGEFIQSPLFDVIFPEVIGNVYQNPELLEEL